MTTSDWVDVTNIPSLADLGSWIATSGSNGLTRSEGVFGVPTACDEHIALYATTFCTRYRIPIENAEGIITRLKDLVQGEVVAGRDVPKERVATLLSLAVEPLRHVDPASAAGFDGCIPDASPADLCPGDVQEMVRKCTTAIKVKSLENRAEAERMKKVFFTQIVPRAMEAASMMMGLLEELEGEEFDYWMDELDELGFIMTVIVPEGSAYWPSVDGGRFFAPAGTPVDLISAENSFCGQIRVFSEWYEMIKFVYEGSVSPWLMFLSEEDLCKNIVGSDPRWVVGALIEWKENVQAVDLSAALSSQMSSAVRDFIDV